MNPTDPTQSSWLLLERARAGDGAALEQMAARYRAVLLRWAHGRLPASARGLHDTEDLVQIVLSRALRRLHEFESRREGAFLAYLRAGIVNEVRQAIRTAARRPRSVPVDEAIADGGMDPLANAIQSEFLDRYEAGLRRLKPEQREAVILCLEFRFSHAQIADAMGRPSANAARKLVDRALERLATIMETLR